MALILPERINPNLQDALSNELGHLITTNREGAALAFRGAKGRLAELISEAESEFAGIIAPHGYEPTARYIEYNLGGVNKLNNNADIHWDPEQKAIAAISSNSEVRAGTFVFSGLRKNIERKKILSSDCGIEHNGDDELKIAFLDRLARMGVRATVIQPANGQPVLFGLEHHASILLPELTARVVFRGLSRGHQSVVA